MRIDRIFRFDTFIINAYLDVQNVYYHKNVEAYNYQFDFKKRDPIYGLSSIILPSVGLRGEF